MLRKYFFSISLLLFITVFYTRCSTNKFDIDVSKVNISMSNYRFDKDVFYIQNRIPREKKQELEGKYGMFYKVFVEQIIRVGSSDSLKTIAELKKFSNDPFIQAIQKKIELKFKEKEIEKFNRKITDGFKHYNYYFPEKTIPEIIYYNSGFNYGIVTLENHIGIGLDFYLGKEDSLVKMMSGEVFHQYEKDKMDPKFLVRDVFDGWLRNEFSSAIDKKDLLSVLISEGKLMYLLEALLPAIDEATLMRYNSEELDWANKKKKNIWTELAKQKVIYGTKNFDNQKWITEGPFTNVGAIPEDSPARLGVWMGWNIVKAYMNDHPEISLQQLLMDKNYQVMLNSYKP